MCVCHSVYQYVILLTIVLVTILNIYPPWAFWFILGFAVVVDIILYLSRLNILAL